MFDALTPENLETIEEFFTTRGAVIHHEVSPFAGVGTMQLLCVRAYDPIEVSNVLYRPIELPFETVPAEELAEHIKVRIVGPDEAVLWSEVNARGWTHERPEFEPFIRDIGTLLVNRENSPCFIAEIDGQPCAAGALAIHQGVALLAGASTVPEFRRRGLQTALLEARIRFACEQACDLAMMVAESGCNSQRNAQRQGFLIAYTRVKWRKWA